MPRPLPQSLLARPVRICFDESLEIWSAGAAGMFSCTARQPRVSCIRRRKDPRFLMRKIKYLHPVGRHGKRLNMELQYSIILQGKRLGEHREQSHQLLLSSFLLVLRCRTNQQEYPRLTTARTEPCLSTIPASAVTKEKHVCLETAGKVQL